MNQHLLGFVVRKCKENLIGILHCNRNITHTEDINENNSITLQSYASGHGYV
jgi:hypothetical protein